MPNRRTPTPVHGSKAPESAATVPPDDPGARLSVPTPTTPVAAPLAPDTSTRDFRKVLYGQIYLTGQVLSSNSAAWYRFTDDDVYLRTNLKGGRGDLHHLCHELGHRYWHRFLGTNGQYANDVLFNNLGHGMLEPVKMPEVGEHLPFLLKGFPDDNQPVIARYMGDRIYLSTDGYVGFKMVWDHLERMQKESKYPTPYSASKATEFFPECFAMYALGTLPAEYVPAFERVLDYA